MNATKPSKSFQVNDSEIQAHCTTQSIRVQDADGSVARINVNPKHCNGQGLYCSEPPTPPSFRS